MKNTTLHTNNQLDLEKESKNPTTQEQAFDKPNKNLDIRLSAAIMAALDVEQAFKLYSYRIISPEDYLDRIDEIAKTIKKIK